MQLTRPKHPPHPLHPEPRSFSLSSHISGSIWRGREMRWLVPVRTTSLQRQLLLLLHLDAYRSLFIFAMWECPQEHVCFKDLGGGLRLWAPLSSLPSPPGTLPHTVALLPSISSLGFLLLPSGPHTSLRLTILECNCSSMA